MEKTRLTCSSLGARLEEGRSELCRGLSGLLSELPSHGGRNLLTFVLTASPSGYICTGWRAGHHRFCRLETAVCCSSWRRGSDLSAESFGWGAGSAGRWCADSPKSPEQRCVAAESWRSRSRSWPAPHQGGGVSGATSNRGKGLSFAVNSANAPL
jgi:hypothetical protein